MNSTDDTPSRPTDPSTNDAAGSQPEVDVTQASADNDSHDTSAREAFAQIAELAKKAEERDQLFDQLQRLNADFQNFKSRMTKEKADDRRYAVRDAVRSLLPALDNLERALSVDATADPMSVLEGVRMTADQFRTGLESVGVKRISAEGTPLDPRCMDAVHRVETTDQPSNTVISVFEHGYMLNDLIVRPAKVAVAVAPSSSSNTAS